MMPTNAEVPRVGKQTVNLRRVIPHGRFDASPRHHFGEWAMGWPLVSGTSLSVFESRFSDQFGPIAHRVEHPAFNRSVEGS